MARPKVIDMLMWVGVSNYSTVMSFTREAVRLGVSKRVAQVPVGVKLGKSLMFLAHDEAVRVTCTTCKGRGVTKGKLQVELVKKVGRVWEPVLRPSKKGAVRIRNTVAEAKTFREMRDDTYRTSDRKHKWRPVPGQAMCEDCKGRGERPDGRIFGFCVVDRLELVFDCAAAAKEYRERRETLGKRDRVPVTYVPGIENEPRRSCGHRHIGGYYLVAGGEDASSDAQTLADGLGTGFAARGPLVVFSEPVAYPVDRFRGAKVVDKHLILKAAKAGKGPKKRATRRRSKPSR